MILRLLTVLDERGLLLPRLWEWYDNRRYRHIWPNYPNYQPIWP